MASGHDSSTRERLLDAADVLMHERGYEAVGVAELCSAANAKKGSFYFFFDSKQALALEMLERSWHRTRTQIFEPAFGDPTLDAVQAIDRYGHLLADNLERLRERNDVVAGCRFGNFAIEMAPRDDTIRAAVSSILDEMVDLVAESIERSAVGAGGDDSGARATAAAVIAQMEGLMVLAKARRDPSLLRGLGAVAGRLLH
ncbi:MAG: helix-turn-helix domain-containing protein [Actinomycetota bacterium]